MYCPYQENDNGKTMTCKLLVEIGGPSVLAGSSRPSFICGRCQNEWTNGLPNKDNPPEILKKIAESGKSNVEMPGLLQLGVNFVKSAVKQVVNGLPETPERERKIRLDVCGVYKPKESQCEMLENGRCKLCGCFVEEKAKWATADCDLKKWPKNEFTGRKGCGSCGGK